jgi:predicted RNA-binding protein YlqC (UPF0109 family)
MTSPKILTEQTTTIATLNELIAGLVHGLVRHPEHVLITHSIHGALVAFVIRTHPEDVRRLVGARGKHLKAITSLAEEFALRHELEAHLVIDEKNPPSQPGSLKTGVFGTSDRMTEESLEKLLFNTVKPFADDTHYLEVTTASVGPTKILEVKIPTQFYLCVYGKASQFDYGVDGHVIGAIKNIFDGISKNQGMLIRITLTRV